MQTLIWQLLGEKTVVLQKGLEGHIVLFMSPHFVMNPLKSHKFRQKSIKCYPGM